MSNESKILQAHQYEQRRLDERLTDERAALQGLRHSTERALGDRTAQQILDEARKQKALNEAMGQRNAYADRAGIESGQEAKKCPKKDTDTVQRNAYADRAGIESGQEAKKCPKKDTDTVQRILDKRGEKYGDYAMMCLAAQTLKSVIARRPGNYSHVQQESLDMICTKLARIAVGNCNEIDSWRDIAGYATLITNILMKKQ